MILKFSQFSESLKESGIPVYRGSSVQSEKTVKSNGVMEEIKDALEKMKSGQISEISVVAEIPTYGKRAPAYIKDIFAEAGIESSDDMYDERGEERNIFVDSEFIVKGIDPEKGSIIATPYSLRKKGIEIEIDPNDIIEIFYR